MNYKLQFGELLPYWDVLLWGLLFTVVLTRRLDRRRDRRRHRRRIGAHLRAEMAAAALVAGYVEVIRNTPFIVQLFFIFFGLPAPG